MFLVCTINDSELGRVHIHTPAPHIYRGRPYTIHILSVHHDNHPGSPWQPSIIPGNDCELIFNISLKVAQHINTREIHPPINQPSITYRSFIYAFLN